MAIKKFPAAVRMSSALSTTANLAVEAGGTRRDVGKVVTQLNHHKSGNTKLARDVFSLSLLEKILRNP